MYLTSPQLLWQIFFPLWRTSHFLIIKLLGENVICCYYLLGTIWLFWKTSPFMGLPDKFGRKSDILAMMLSRRKTDVVRATGLGLEYKRIILIFRETWKGISLVIESSRGHFILVNPEAVLVSGWEEEGKRECGKVCFEDSIFLP